MILVVQHASDDHPRAHANELRLHESPAPETVARERFDIGSAQAVAPVCEARLVTNFNQLKLARLLSFDLNLHDSLRPVLSRRVELDYLKSHRFRSF
jgi:hypothetical protein